MASASVTIADLRQLLAARFPEKTEKPAGLVPTGVRAIDEALGGGLPAGRLTELVAAAPGCGGQLVLAQLLATTRAARQRVALIDGADAFAPEAVSPDTLRHLVWVRCRTLDQTLGVADLLVRDGNYAAVVLDLCGCPERALRRTPATLWHRLHRAAESGGAVLVKAPRPLVPAVPWRLVLAKPLGPAAHRRPQQTLADRIVVEVARGHAEAAGSDSICPVIARPRHSGGAVAIQPLDWSRGTEFAEVLDCFRRRSASYGGQVVVPPGGAPRNDKPGQRDAAEQLAG
ncbi:MAG: hypothetical protein A3G75_10880 [Verrucomicrobia bacterium RIFCSPLOWO2_12_FULL_64_8]|nr:MAG: hypothetical protein A3G75_10880 [Verrucomicrobia bacterium RIFCSPLOWO2_12_FULL_64_8]